MTVLLIDRLVFQDRVSLGSVGCPGTISIDQAGLHVTEICLPLLGLKACAIMPGDTSFLRCREHDTMSSPSP